MINKDEFLKHSGVEIDQQFKEELERADEIYNSLTKPSVNLAVIGKRIIDTLCDDNLSLNNKRAVLEELSGTELEDNDFYYSLLCGDLVHPYEYVMIDARDRGLELTGCNEERFRIMEDDRLGSEKKSRLTVCINVIERLK